jgi:hypothetical protein
MLDPITVIATASAAYNALKKGIEIGRELQDMGWAAWRHLGRRCQRSWTILGSEGRGPSRGGSVGSNVQAEAMEIFAAKREDRKLSATELKTFVQYSYGQSGWEELLRIEAASAQAQAGDGPPQSRDQGNA